MSVRKNVSILCTIILLIAVLLLACACNNNQEVKYVAYVFLGYECTRVYCYNYEIRGNIVKLYTTEGEIITSIQNVVIVEYNKE